MDSIRNAIKRLERSPNKIRFKDLSRICEEYFGPPRIGKGSHQMYKTPWQDDPRINIQNENGKAKAYQVKQVITALKRLEVVNDNTSNEEE
jgi:hypothetical protein